MNNLEKNLQAKILRKINQIPGCVAFANVVTAYSPTGHSDIYGTVHGFSLWAEVKRGPDEELTKIQQGFLHIVGKESYLKNTFVWNDVQQPMKDVAKLARLVRRAFWEDPDDPYGAGENCKK